MNISPAERQKYSEIFASLGPNNGYISGFQARQVLQNSGLDINVLGQIWDICDIDKDGSMDFDEFSLAMRFVYAVSNGEISHIPATLPHQMIPPSKMHYFTGSGGYGQQSYMMNHVQAQPTAAVMNQNLTSNYSAISTLDTEAAVSKNLSDDFDWYIAPSDRSNYEAIYRNNVQLSTGEVRMGQFEGLYQSLQIPRDDINAACRRLGKRVPTTLPSVLRTSFLGGSNYELSDSYAVDEIRQQPGRPSVPMSFATKSAFSSQKGHAMADDYLSRLNQKDHTATETHAQEERLKRELEEIKRQIKEVEDRAYASRGTGQDKDTAVRELRDLLVYKQQQVLNDDASSLDRQLLDQDREIQRQREALKKLSEVMQGVREQKALLETHLEDSESELHQCQQEVERLRARS
ncbi:endocytosis defective- protein [Lunasporangiospora selenospora]|uniref:Endocytosis protein 3 n=1 Tax=Lunasporangiospora selenospora TaxID=979761 RepID=A0A9P6G2D4_9FUNG|nr:endocytosis defective- protein [Lunasporangiospora selenospora]